MKNKTIKVFVDLDGVLADFEGAVVERFGKPMNDLKKGALWGSITRYNDDVAPWFYSLPMTPDGQELWDFIIANFEQVEILSASGTTPRDAVGQKKAWIGEKLGWDVKANIVTSSNEKAAFATPFSLLVDDSDRAVKPFERAGGMIIKHVTTKQTIKELKILLGITS